MSKRINVILPDSTVAVLNRVARKGNRSRLIAAAVLHYIKTESTENLRARLKQGYMANAERDLEIAEEWFPIEEEAWQKVYGAATHRPAASALSSGRVLKAIAAPGAALRIVLMTTSNNARCRGGRRTPPPITTHS